MKYIGNAFSLQMVALEDLPNVRMGAWSDPRVADPDMDYCDRTPNPPDAEGAVSIIGHADLAAMLGLPFNRQSVILQHGDVLYVAQVIGGRLPEGCTTLPDGVAIQWIYVEIV